MCAEHLLAVRRLERFAAELALLLLQLHQKRKSENMPRIGGWYFNNQDEVFLTFLNLDSVQDTDLQLETGVSGTTATSPHFQLRILHGGNSCACLLAMGKTNLDVHFFDPLPLYELRVSQKVRGHKLRGQASSN